jgi:hypothetical protein
MIASMDEIKAILVKDGKDWTNEESIIIHKAIKKHGRAELKIIREELRN